MRRFDRRKLVLSMLGLFTTAVYLNNASWLATPIAGGPYLVAHRGLGQGFDRRGLTAKTCTAARMLPPEHPFLENTIPAMQAAFDDGADAVELDVQRTADDRFVVFHDWTVDCRTEGSGATREHTLEELQRLDIGYGYTADGGRTWPFRGAGVGLMPSLEEVLSSFPDRDFILDVKSNDPSEGQLLADHLLRLPAHHRGDLAVVGGERPVAVIRDRLPQLRTMTRPRLKRCLTRYLALGWTGQVPADCRNGLLLIPVNVAPWLWGWPHRLLRRMQRAGSRVILIGDYDGGPAQGLDDPARASELPPGYSGGIWTDRIDRIGPAMDPRQGSPGPRIER